MSFEDERLALESRFKAGWAETAIRWPNVKFSSKDKSEWVSYNNIQNTAKEKSLGTDPVLYRYFGDIVIQIFVVPNSGASRALQLAELVADIWRSAKFSGITMDVPSTVSIGIIEGWYQIDVISPYYRDSFESRSIL